MKTAALLVLLGSTPALGAPLGLTLGEDRQSGVAGALGFTTTSFYRNEAQLDLVSATIDFEVLLMLQRQFEMTLRWGVTGAGTSGGIPGVLASGRTGVETTNPFISLAWAVEEPGFRSRLGIGFTAPWSSGRWQSDPIERTVFGAALLSQGLWNAWQYEPGSAFVVIPATFAFSVDGDWEFLGDIAAGVRVRSTEDFQRTSQLISQLGMQAVRQFDALHAGLRIQGVRGGIDGLDERPQMTVAPMLGFATRPLDLSLKFLIHLNEPAGFSFTQGGFWGIQLGGTWKS